MVFNLGAYLVFGFHLRSRGMLSKVKSGWESKYKKVQSDASYLSKHDQVKRTIRHTYAVAPALPNVPGDAFQEWLRLDEEGAPGQLTGYKDMVPTKFEFSTWSKEGSNGMPRGQAYRVTAGRSHFMLG